MTWEFFRNFIFSKRAGSLIRRIAWLSVISICFSVTAFLLVLFVMLGMNHGIEKRIVALEPHLSVKIPTIRDSKLMELHPVYVKLTQDDQLEVSLFETQDVVLRSSDGQFRGAIAQGISIESMHNIQRRLDELNSNKKGRDAYLERWQPEETPGEGEIAIGADLARALRVTEGDILTVIPPEALLLPAGEAPKFDKVRVRKVIYSNLSDIDGQYIFYQREKALTGLKNNTSRRLGLEVWTPHIHDVDDLKKEVSKFEGIQAETWKDRNSDLFFALLLEKIVIGVFLALAAILSASSIVGVLSLLLFQKQREIKLLKALGFSRRMTLKTFCQIGTLLSTSGVLVGTILGTGIGLYIQAYPLDIFPDIYYDTHLPSRVDPWLVFSVLFVGLAIGFFGAYFPSRGVADQEIGKI